MTKNRDAVMQQCEHMQHVPDMPAAATVQFQPGPDLAGLPDLRLRLCAVCAGNAYARLAEYYEQLPSAGRVFEPNVEEPTPRAALLVSSATVVHVGTHDRVRLWVRGALAGDLVVPEHDGAFLARELGLHEAGGWP